MGADFISYCVFGPRKLSLGKKMMTKAQKQMTEFVKKAVALEELEKKADDGVPGADDALGVFMDENLRPYQEVSDITWATAYKKDPMKLVKELIEIWHKSPRDSNWRYVPGSNQKRIVWYCGEMTWGDEPDGEGYQTMRRADLAGLHEIFGLE